MRKPSIALARYITEACKAKGIRHIVLSPGSRNAPLTIGYTADPYFTCYSVVDERSAAFFALGIAQQITAPVAVVCTSGSAVLNYHPAVAEAYYSNVPLVVISADRPTSKLDIGDGQTIRQAGVLSNHTTFDANLSDNEVDARSNTYLLNRALNAAITESLPVHINAPFEEPLYETTTENVVFENIPPTPPTNYLNESHLEGFLSRWNAASRKMVLVGVLAPGSLEEKYVRMLAEDPSVLVLTETTSNLHHPQFVPYIDKLLTAAHTSEMLSDLRPEILLTFGGMVVSKKIKQFLREWRPAAHYHICPHKGYDTYFCLTHHFRSQVNVFFREIAQRWQAVASDYQQKWLQLMEEVAAVQQSYLSEAPFSDFKALEIVLSAIPEGYNLQLANSSTVRYAQLLPSKPSWRVWCNRGTSGIDGSTSTAVGAAVANKKPTAIVTGDLSFFYDSNALWNNYIPNSFKMILLNNGGGGIFRILPGDKSDKNFEQFFETPHHLSAENFCATFGIRYQSANDLSSLKEKITSFFNESNKPTLLEIFTEREKNDKVLLNYFAVLKKFVLLRR